MSKLSVHLVSWNGAKYIPYLFESLRAQTFKDWKLLVIDNGSKDGTADLIEKELKDFPVFSRFIQNKENIGFAPGHNQAIRMTTDYGLRTTDYIQLLNQDMYLAPDYFEKIVKMMEERTEAGAGQGLLLRWDFNKQDRTNIIDTMGLKVLRYRRVVDWKTGEYNAPQPPLNLRGGEGGVIEVFGVSGALPIYRRKAIEQVMFENQVFDQDFFMYKEDVDLAFRLRGAGWKAYAVLDAKAWHDRSAAGPNQMTDKVALMNRKTKSAFVNYHSYKNHLMVLIKNEQRANLTKDWPWIFWYEFKKFVYLLLTDWKTLKGLSEIKRLWPRLMQKRKQVMSNYNVTPKEMRKWYV